MLLVKSSTLRELVALIIYCVSLTSLFGISALYHRINWQPNTRMWMRRIDHAAIYILIAGTSTPIFLLGLQGDAGFNVLTFIWGAAILGIIKSAIWVKAPKWLAAALYIGAGWMAVPYLDDLRAMMGGLNVLLILLGGVIYSLGAVIYALKRPNPVPHVFGYHEIFHLLVIVAATLHFIVITRLV
jgi:hemolysin III